MSEDVIVRRRLRLSVVVAVAAGVVAAGVTGAGLLVPAGPSTSVVRVGGAFVAVAAGAVVVRLDGAARGVTTLAVVAATAAAVCLVTLPLSPVTLGSAADRDGAAGGDQPDGNGSGRDSVIEPGRGEGGVPSPAIALPPGGDVVVEQGRVFLTDPAGGRLVIGEATLEGASPRVASEGTALVVVDGVVHRGDDGAIGAGVALGGTTFERADGSRVTVAEGGLHEVPVPLEGDDDSGPAELDAVLALLLGAFAMVAFAPPLVGLRERSPVSLVDEPERPPAPASRPGTTVEEGLADVLRSMLADPDPRTSVIGAYARLLAGMAEAGYPRRAEEGPHEHLWRSLGPLGVRRPPVHRLAELFVRARFTPHPVTEADRQAAIGALADAVADLRLQAGDVHEVAATVGATA